ncbi:MAG: hypothetical protein ACE5EN_09935 [Nitrospinota bacterium]
MSDEHPGKRQIVDVMIFSALLFLLYRKIDGPDIWYHLSIGREVFRTFSVPLEEFLVYTLAGEPGIFHAWGFGLFYYLIYTLAGFWGMSLANSALGALVIFLLFKTERANRSPDPGSILVLCGALWLMQFRLIYRPETALFLLLAGQIYLLERFMEDRRWRRLAIIPMLTFLAIQAHPSVLIAMGVYAFYSLQILWDNYRENDGAARTAGGLALVGICSVAASLVNPYGLEQLLMPFTLAAQGEMLKDLVEFLHIYETEYLLPYIALVIVSAIALVLQPRKRFVYWILFFVFGYMALTYVRNLALFALVMYVPVARATSYLADKYIPSNDPVANRLLQSLAAAVVIYTTVAMVSDSSWGSGPSAGEFPEKSAAVVMELRPPGRVFNFYDMGGYLSWTFDGRYQVSIDSRQLTKDRSLVLHDQVLTSSKGWEGVLRRYDVNMIIIPATLPYSGMLIPLAPVLADSNDWMLAATEERAMLFLRNGAVPGLPKERILDKRLVWKQIISEAAKNIEEYPEHPMAYLALGRARLRAGKRTDAIAPLRRYLQLRPKDRIYADLLNRLESAVR